MNESLMMLSITLPNVDTSIFPFTGQKNSKHYQQRINLSFNCLYPEAKSSECGMHDIKWLCVFITLKEKQKT